MAELLCFLKKMGVYVGNLCLSSFSLASPYTQGALPQLRLTDLSEACILRASVSSPAPTLYSAPEAFECESVGVEADAFSFGVVLCELLYGFLPFESEEALLEEEPVLPEEDPLFGAVLLGLIRSKGC